MVPLDLQFRTKLLFAFLILVRSAGQSSGVARVAASSSSRDEKKESLDFFIECEFRMLIILFTQVWNYPDKFGEAGDIVTSCRSSVCLSVEGVTCMLVMPLGTWHAHAEDSAHDMEYDPIQFYCLLRLLDSHSKCMIS